MALPARKIIPGSERRLEEVSLSLDGRRVVFLFENGEGYAIPRERLPGDDGAPIVAIQIFDHRHAVSISQSSGTAYDLPWDSIKHYAAGGRQKRPAFGRRLKEHRERRGITQSALSRASGLSRMQMARLEKGASSPSLETVLRIANALKTRPEDLLA